MLFLLQMKKKKVVKMKNIFTIQQWHCLRSVFVTFNYWYYAFNVPINVSHFHVLVHVLYSFEFIAMAGYNGSTENCWHFVIIIWWINSHISTFNLKKWRKSHLEKSCPFYLGAWAPIVTFFVLVELLGCSFYELPLNYHPKFVASVWINTKALKSVNRLLCLLRIKRLSHIPEWRKTIINWIF